jgi:OmcA/MtrC family decaheme c-type cytochrome
MIIHNKAWLTRLVGLVAVLACALGSKSASKKPYSVHDKAYYAADAVVNFVRPGLVFKVTSATIAADGTIQVKFTVSDPLGLPLDRLGVNTPGPVSVSFVAATIPKGQKQYTSYTTRVRAATTGSATAIQAAADAGGTFTSTADGQYTYTFNTKAPSGFDASATHTIGMYGSRNLTSFGLVTSYATTTFNFVPNGSAVATVRDVVRTQTCNNCHDQLSFHGGSRRGVEMCVMCHTAQTTDPNSGNTVNFPVLIHRIHMGKSLPSVKAGKPYLIGTTSFSDVGFPADPGGATMPGGKATSGVQRCEVCHDQKSGAQQANAYMTNPNRAACGACHDDVNFASGLNHVDLPQPNDNLCSQCHTPQGEMEFDASIKGAHQIPTESSMLPGFVLSILNVNNGTAGSKPTITFTAKDNSGNPVPMTELQVSPGRLAAVMAGPTSDYGYTSFGSDVTTPGYVSEDVTRTSSCGQDGTCTYTFTHAIPANATGTYSIGMEGRRAGILLPGTTKQLTVSYGAKNVVTSFSVDGSPVQPRRAVVATTNCNQCHTKLSVHGENRNQIEMCVLCHNPSENDSSTRASATVAADKTQPPQSVNFDLMVHKIHIAVQQPPTNGNHLVIVGFGGSHNDFSDVGFPAMSPTGSTGDTRNCSICHVNGSEQNLPTGLNMVKTPNGLINPTPPVTAACTACHSNLSALSHAVANTTIIGESCETCHGAQADFNVGKVHAQY